MRYIIIYLQNILISLQITIVHRILGLSAYIDPIKLRLLTAIAPICAKVNTAEASKLGLISEYKIYTIYHYNYQESEKINIPHANNNFNRLFTLFDKDLKLMYACMKPSYI